MESLENSFQDKFPEPPICFSASSREFGWEQRLTRDARLEINCGLGSLLFNGVLFGACTDLRARTIVAIG